MFYLSGGCYLYTGTLNTHQRSMVKTVIAGHFHSSGNPSYIQLESCIFLIMPHAPLQSEKDVTKARISFIFTRSVKHIWQKPGLRFPGISIYLRLSQAPLVRITSRSHLLQALFRLSLDSKSQTPISILSLFLTGLYISIISSPTSLVNDPQEPDQGGINTPPSLNCDTVHHPQNVPICPYFARPAPRPLRLTSFVVVTSA